MKKHIIELKNKNNSKLQKIKKKKRLNNVNETLNYLIEDYNLKNCKDIKRKKK